ncbi:MAG: hypothetical protein Q9170_005866 [Blastenia crenularia]
MRVDLRFLSLTLIFFTHSVIAAPATTINADTNALSRSTSSINHSGLGRPPWPDYFYTLRLIEGYYIAVKADRYQFLHPPSPKAIQSLIYDFSDDIEAAYPPPGLSPPKAHLDYYDMESLTKLEISEEAGTVITWSKPAPTKILLDALRKLAQECGRWEPPRMVHVFIAKKRSGSSDRADRFNAIQLSIRTIGVDSGPTRERILEMLLSHEHELHSVHKSRTEEEAGPDQQLKV